MRKTNEFLTYVLDQLRLLRNLEARAMFGGHGLYRDGIFFGIISKGRLFLRTGPSTRPKFIEAGMKPFRPSAQQTLKSYYEVPAEVLDDASTFAHWAEEAAHLASDPSPGRTLAPDSPPPRTPGRLGPRFGAAGPRRSLPETRR